MSSMIVCMSCWLRSFLKKRRSVEVYFLRLCPAWIIDGEAKKKGDCEGLVEWKKLKRRVDVRRKNYQEQKKMKYEQTKKKKKSKFVNTESKIDLRNQNLNDPLLYFTLWSS